MPGTGDAFDRPNYGFTDPFPPRSVEISTDEELIARLNIRREERIFELIYQRHLLWVWKLAFHSLAEPCRHLTWHLCLETFYSLWNRFPGYRLAGPLDTFLTPSVRQLSENYRLSEGPQTACPEETWMNRMFHAAAAGNDALAERISLALRGLPAEWRQVIRWRYGNGCSLAELASRTDFPRGIIRWRHFQAVRRVRELVEHKGFPESWRAGSGRRGY